jgi:hypothetical protein
MTLTELIARWRADADLFDRYGDAQKAQVCRVHADEVEAAVRAAENDTLTLAEAALASGYSVDRLRHMVAEGRLANVGHKGAPRLRRGDLPIKTRAPGRFDPVAAARALRRPRASGDPRHAA